jgi:hypothetical protein
MYAISHHLLLTDHKRKNALGNFENHIKEYRFAISFMISFMLFRI